MKKLFVLLVICIAVFVGMLITSFASEKIGDVNNDGKITAADARLVLRHSASLERLPDSVLINADADGNGRITAADARLILRVSANLDSFKEKNPTTELTTEKQTSAKPEETTSAKPEETTAVTTEEPTSAKSEETTSVAPEDPTVTPLPGSAEEILNIYRDEANQFKSTAMSYYRFKYDELIDTDLDTDSSFYYNVNRLFVTDKDIALRYECNDRSDLPLFWSENCCELTDSDVIESASVTENDGKTTVTIILKPETDPILPYSAEHPYEDGVNSDIGYTCKMFDCFAPLYLEVLPNMADFIGAEVSNPSCSYANCTSTLVFDSEAHLVESLEQSMDVRISADVNINGVVERKYIDVRAHNIIDEAKYYRTVPPYNSIDAEVKTGDDVVLPDEAAIFLEPGKTGYIKGTGFFGNEIELAIGTDSMYMVEEVDSEMTFGIYCDKNNAYMIDPKGKTYTEINDHLLNMLGFGDLSVPFFTNDTDNIVDATSYTYTVDGDTYEKFILITDENTTCEIDCLNGKMTYVYISSLDEYTEAYEVYIDEYSAEIPAHMVSPTKGCIRLTPMVFLATLSLSNITDDIFFPFI